MSRTKFLIGLFVSILAMGTLACAAPASDNETMAVRAGSQPVWSNEGSDSDELLVTLKSSRAQLGEGADAFIKASANNRSGKPLSVNMVMQLGNGLLITSTNSCSGDPCTGHFELQDGIQGLMSMQVRSGGLVADSYSIMLHYDYTDPEGNKVRGKVEGLLGSSTYIASSQTNEGGLESQSSPVRQTNSGSSSGANTSGATIKTVNGSPGTTIPVPTRTASQRNYKPYDVVIAEIGTEPSSSDLLSPESAIGLSDGTIFVVDRDLVNGEMTVVKIFDNDGNHLKNVQTSLLGGNTRSVEIDDFDRVSIVDINGNFVRLNSDGSIFSAGKPPVTLGNYPLHSILDGMIIGSYESASGVRKFGVLEGSEVLELFSGKNGPIALVDQYSLAYVYREFGNVQYQIAVQTDGRWDRKSSTYPLPTGIDGDDHIEAFAVTSDELYVVTREVDRSALFKIQLTQGDWELVVEIPQLPESVSPTYLSLGNDGNFYLADAREKMILIVDSKTGSTREFTTHNSKDSLDFINVISSNPADGTVWLQNRGSRGTIDQYDEDFNLAFRIRGEKTDSHWLRQRYLGGVTSQGELVFVERVGVEWEDLIRIRDSKGLLLREWGGLGRTSNIPQVWVDSYDDMIYVWEPEAGRMQKFNLTGLPIGEWGLSELIDEKRGHSYLCGFARFGDSFYLAADGDEGLTVIDTMGNIARVIPIPGLTDKLSCGPDLPGLLAIDRDGNFYFAGGKVPLNPDVVYIFNNIGEPLSQIDYLGDIHALEFDDQGYLWVAYNPIRESSTQTVWAKAVKLSQ